MYEVVNKNNQKNIYDASQVRDGSIIYEELRYRLGCGLWRMTNSDGWWLWKWETEEKYSIDSNICEMIY